MNTSIKTTLDVIEGPHAGQSYLLDGHSVFFAGRSDDAHLKLVSDTHFSRYHFLIEFLPPQCLLRDLGSTNGTYVNGQRVTTVTLKHGDEISGGRTRIRVSITGELATDDKTGCWQGTHVDGFQPGMPSQLPTTITVPGYEFVRELGRGGMGVVQLVRHTSSGTLRALKTIVPESASDEKALGLFLREISVLSRLRHNRIVSFVEMGLAQGTFYFVMEYVESTDLMSVLESQSTGSRIRVACAIVCQILSGLEYAHQLGFVHRDVKPGNVLAGYTGAKLTAKLGDFGLAKSFENAGFSGMTRDGQAVGTLKYMAPEQIIDARRATPSVDIYAAGATLYSLITGTTPHPAVSGQDPLVAILSDPPTPLKHHCPKAPIALCDAIDRSLRPLPGDRFATAAAMRDALLPFSTSEFLRRFKNENDH